MNDRLPILDLSRAYAEIRDEVRGALERVFEAQSFILGREVRTFEEHVESYLELPEGSAIGCASGTDAPYRAALSAAANFSMAPSSEASAISSLRRSRRRGA